MASSLSRHTCLPQASVINSGSHFRPLAQQVVIHVEQGEDLFSVAKAGLQRLDGAVQVVKHRTLLIVADRDGGPWRYPTLSVGLADGKRLDLERAQP